MGVIAANPDQSKHLETATMHLCGLSLDLVNLRSETYTETSRIPQVRAHSCSVEDAIHGAYQRADRRTRGACQRADQDRQSENLRPFFHFVN